MIEENDYEGVQLRIPMSGIGGFEVRTRIPLLLYIEQ